MRSAERYRSNISFAEMRYRTWNLYVSCHLQSSLTSWLTVIELIDRTLRLLILELHWFLRDKCMEMTSLLNLFEG